MDTIILDLLVQVPALGVLAWMVHYFFKHLQTIREEAIKVQEASINSIRENTKVLSAMQETMRMVLMYMHNEGKDDA